MKTETLIETDHDLTQIINGVEVMSSSPFNYHQEVVENIYDEIKAYVKKGKHGWIALSPLDVILEEGMNRLQPDLFFISTANSAIIQDWIRGVPDLTIEVVSKGSLKLDTQDKKAIYEKYGVKEFWLVFPEFQAIEIFTLENGKYVLTSFAEEKGIVESTVLNGYALDISKIFS
jgi:Uma2 family endonuclease